MLVSKFENLNVGEVYEKYYIEEEEANECEWKYAMATCPPFYVYTKRL